VCSNWAFGMTLQDNVSTQGRSKSKWNKPLSESTKKNSYRQMANNVAGILVNAAIAAYRPPAAKEDYTSVIWESPSLRDEPAVPQYVIAIRRAPRSRAVLSATGDCSSIHAIRNLSQRIHSRPGTPKPQMTAALEHMSDYDP
jgi:hypothetical protein